LQLIEIVQLVLVGFATLILVIFLVSYFGYKARNKNKINTSPTDVLFNQKKTESESSKQIVNKTQKSKTATSADKLQKFEVFNPNTSKELNQKLKESKKHFPRTLSIR
jgi:amino acid permease